MSEKTNWKYCVVGNIVKTHSDENGVVRYGTPAFTGGTKVYLCGKYWDNTYDTITVIGLNRGKKYQTNHIAPHLIENVRCSKVYNPAILDIMNNLEFEDWWWGNQKKDKIETIDFVNRWNHNNSK